MESPAALPLTILGIVVLFLLFYFIHLHVSQWEYLSVNIYSVSNSMGGILDIYEIESTENNVRCSKRTGVWEIKRLVHSFRKKPKLVWKKLEEEKALQLQLQAKNNNALELHLD